MKVRLWQHVAKSAQQLERVCVDWRVGFGVGHTSDLVRAFGSHTFEVELAHLSLLTGGQRDGFSRRVSDRDWLLG